MEVVGAALPVEDIVTASGDITYRFCDDCLQGWWNYKIRPGTYVQTWSRLVERACEQGLSTINCPAVKGNKDSDFF